MKAALALLSLCVPHPSLLLPSPHLPVCPTFPYCFLFPYSSPGAPASCSDPQSPTYPRPPRPIPAGTTLVTTRSPPPPPWRPRQPRLLEAVVTVLNLERKVVQSLLEWQAKADFHLFPLVTFVHGGLPGQSYLLPQAEEGPDLIYYFSSVCPSVR